MQVFASITFYILFFTKYKTRSSISFQMLSHLHYLNASDQYNNTEKRIKKKRGWWFLRKRMSVIKENN